MSVFTRVAGAGIAPASRGYEPREVLLLYPANSISSRSGYTLPHNLDGTQL